MCVNPYKPKPLSLEFGFNLSEDIEKNIFKDNINRISKSIEKGEKKLIKLLTEKPNKK